MSQVDHRQYSQGNSRENPHHRYKHRRDDNDERRIIIEGHRKVVITIKVDDECENECGSDGGKGGDGSGVPTGSPLLVVPTWKGDTGTRPVPLAQAIHNENVKFVSARKARDHELFVLQLECIVTNLGVVSCAAGLAEFYVGKSYYEGTSNHEKLTPEQIQADSGLIGRTTFRAPPGGTVSVLCKPLWYPKSFDQAKKGMIVQVSDLLSDRLRRPFDAINDRHVGRNDWAGDIF